MKAYKKQIFTKPTLEYEYIQNLTLVQKVFFILKEKKDVNIQKVDLIKIDVEGNEENVINGCIQLLKKNKPIIVLELKNFNGDSEPNVIKKLKSIGYNNFFELEKKIKFDTLQNNFFLSIIDKFINLIYENPVHLKEIKFFKKKEYQNLIII